MPASKSLISINVLNLNIRTRNALQRSGINYIEDLVKMSDADLISIYGIGIQSYEVLKESLTQFITTHETDITESEPFSDDYSLFQTDEDVPKFFKKINLRYLDIDPNLLNRLNTANIFNLFDVYQTKKRGDWTKTDLLKELSDNLKESRDEQFSVSISSTEKKIVNAVLRNFLGEFHLVDPIRLTKTIERSLIKYRSDNLALDESSYLASIHFQNLLNSDLIISAIDSRIINRIQDAESGLSNNVLLDSIPTWMPANTLRTALQRLEQEKKIRKGPFDRWVVYKVTLTEYLQTLSNQRDKEILEYRLSGETLEEIASRFGLTRERVRQIEERTLKASPPILEDDFIKFYNDYAFTKEEFCDIFDVAPEVYGYMSLTIKTRGIKPIEDLLEDQSIPANIRKNLIDVMRKDSIIVDNLRIPKKTRSIIDYLVMQNMHKRFSIEEFYALYNNFLRENNVTEPELSISIRAFEGVLYRNQNVVATHGKTFAILNVEGIDIEEFIEDLELNKLKNVEMSTLKLFRQFPEQMIMYKIDDHFILHNLLKKLHSKNNLGNIEFMRMPLIRIGDGNRYDQIMELLRQNSPISQEDLADLFYEEYGVEHNTFIANFLRDFQEYYSNGSYDITLKPLSREQKDFLSSKLVKDYYSIEKVKELFEGRFNLPADEYFNKKSFSSFDFILNDKGIVRQKYGSLKGYLDDRIFSNGFIYIDDLDPDLTETMSFKGYLYSLTSNDMFFEFLPRQYVSKERLAEFSIDSTYIDAFRKDVFEWNTSSQYFTIASLKNTGFNLPSHPSRFGDFFFSSLLLNDKKSFSYFRFGRNRVFCKEPAEPIASSFLQDLVRKADAINVDVLVEHLQDHYDISVDKYNVLRNITGTDLFYDPESLTIYAPSSGYNVE